MILKKIRYFLSKLILSKPKVQIQAQEAFDIYEALNNCNYDLLNKHCRSKVAVDLICEQMTVSNFSKNYNIHYFGFDGSPTKFDYNYAYAELVKSKENIKITEFIALYFFTKLGIVTGCKDPFPFDKVLKGRELDIYSAFLDKV
ncbi:hypothetical protein VWH97_05710 [Escherichia coli O157]|nr:hypothetical protein [Escherichia coli O157]